MPVVWPSFHLSAEPDVAKPGSSVKLAATTVSPRGGTLLQVAVVENATYRQEVTATGKCGEHSLALGHGIRLVPVERNDSSAVV